LRSSYFFYLVKFSHISEVLLEIDRDKNGQKYVVAN